MRFARFDRPAWLMRNRYILLADIPLVAIAALGAFALRFDWLAFSSRPEFWPFLLAVLAVKPPLFLWFGMYGRYWRYASATDLVAVTLAVSAASMVVAVGVAAAYGVGWMPTTGFSRPVLLIDWLLTLAAVGGLRMSVRVIGDARQKAQRGGGPSQFRRVLVVGAGEAGGLVVREMQKNPQMGLEPVAFLDDDPNKRGKLIFGVRVLGPLESLDGVVESHRIDEVVMAIPTAGGELIRRVAERCRRAGVKSRAVPGVFELLDGHVTVSRLRSVEISDLLRRKQVVSRPETPAYLLGSTVLVTGAGGSIGSELCRQIAHAKPASLVLLGHGENSIFDLQVQLAEEFPSVRVHPAIADIRDSRRVGLVFERHRPEIVFHAAAHKHVPLMEANQEEAVTNNVLGTLTVAQAAERTGCTRFVLVSTDKAVSPTSVMGASKRLAEFIVKGAAERSGKAFVVVRFGNVLGSRGSVVPFFKRQIERGGPVTVTHPEMERFFMTIPEAVHLVLKAGGMGKGGELFVLNMGEPVRITNLAEDLIRLSGFEVADIGITYAGARPGEKLREELWEHDARVTPTTHAEILAVVEQTDLAATLLPSLLPVLVDAAHAGDRREIEAIFARCFPSFVPGPPVRSDV